MQMKENEHARRILNTEPGRKWECGRPRLRWIDGMMEDLTTMGCRIWRAMAQDRNERQ